MERFVSRLGRRFLLLGVGVLALAGGIAYASVPDSTGMFHACVLSGQGQVRISTRRRTGARQMGPAPPHRRGDS